MCHQGHQWYRSKRHYPTTSPHWWPDQPLWTYMRCDFKLKLLAFLSIIADRFGHGLNRFVKAACKYKRLDYIVFMNIIINNVIATFLLRFLKALIHTVIWKKHRRAQTYCSEWWSCALCTQGPGWAHWCPSSGWLCGLCVGGPRSYW